MNASSDLRSKPVARLVLRGEVPRSVSLDRLPFTIGRRPDASLYLRDADISREHAVVERDAEGYTIRDAGSRHGSTVNGVPVTGEPLRLRARDEIVLGGSARLVFEDTQSLTSLGLLTRAPGAADNELSTLTLFLKAAQSLDGYGAFDDILATMLEYTMRLTNAGRGFVLLGAEGEELKLGRGQDCHGAVLDSVSGVSRSVIREATSTRREFLIDDVAGPAVITGRETLQQHSIRSVAVIPLRGTSEGQMLGLLYLDSQSARHNFGQTDQAILRAIARQAALLLENFRMLEQAREAELLRREIAIAAAIQRQILPQQLPQFAGVRLAAQSVPCAGVGGDFYDVIPVRDGFVAVVGDVCGKGIPAALLAAVAQGMLHAQIQSGVPMCDAVDAINRFVCARSPAERYLTLVGLHYQQPEGGRAHVEVINGGHVLPLLVRADGMVERHQPGDMPVGLLSSARFHVSTLELRAGDRLVILSDGITEAEDAAGEQFGARELEPALKLHDPVQAVFTQLGQFTAGRPAMDDQTILLVEQLI